MRGFHRQRNRLKRSPAGRQSVAFGVRIGYWPCLNAPFIEITWGGWARAFWWGLASTSAREESQNQFGEHT
jgi:hypothetical protein